jgi:signal transduction histidine kinase
VRSSSRPEIIGNDVSARDYFRHAASLPRDDGRMFIGALTQGLTTRRWQLNLAHRLNNPDGSFAGLVAASYDTSVLAEFYREVDVGPRGMIAVVGTADAALRVLVGPTGVEPETSLSGSPAFPAMRAAAEGRWTGPSPTDGVNRIHAFRRIPDRDLTVLVAVDQAEAMRPTGTWEQAVILFATGTTVLVLVMSGLLLHDERMGRRRALALARDRAELAGANMRAQAQAAQLKATLGGMSDGVMMVDAELRLLQWNAHFPAFTGVPEENLRVGLPMEDILRAQARAGEFGPVDVEMEVDRRMALLRAGESTGTIERTRPNGTTMELRRNPLPDGGFVTLYTDITLRRQSEDRLRQAQTMASIGRITSGVAHDFNNLLGTIVGNADMLCRDLANSPQQERRLSLILQASARGSALVRQLLAFSRRQALLPARVDLNAIIIGMIDLLRVTAGPAVALETQLDAGLWPIMADPIQLEHVLLNLVINARDAMPGGGQLSIATRQASLDKPVHPEDLPAGDYVVLEVSDSGIGMTEEVRRHAFEPFFTTKPTGKGSGLGLSQAYGVIRQTGGNIEINSTPGHGTVVTVLLPRGVTMPLPSEAPVPAQPAAANIEAAPPEDSRTILLVDDDSHLRETLAGMLRDVGYTAITAEGGNEALRLIESDVEIDLLLVDVGMPEISGIEVAHAVRLARPALPVVFITGNGEGVSGEPWVLSKPFHLRSLMQMLNHVLEED